MIFGISTQKISEKDRDGYQQQKKGMLVPPLSLQLDCTQFFNMYTRKHLRYLISVQKSATRRNLASGRLYRRGPKYKKRPSLAFLDIFWVLIPKIVVVLAENQYLGRLVLRPQREENGI